MLNRGDAQRCGYSAERPGVARACRRCGAHCATRPVRRVAMQWRFRFAHLHHAWGDAPPVRHLRVKSAPAVDAVTSATTVAAGAGFRFRRPQFDGLAGHAA